MMDSRRARTKPRRVFRSSVNTWNDAIEEAFPLLMNARRWFSLPYLQKKNGIHSNMSRSGTQLNSMASGSCPWRIPNKCYDSRPIMALHEEINDFYNFMSPTPQEHAARRAVIRNIEAVIIEFWPSVWIQVIGSFRTGLYLPTSDINLLVVGSWSRLPLNTLKDALSKKGVCIESCICVVRRTHGPVLELTDKLFDFKIHLSFRSNIGPKSAELIKQYKAKYPALGKLALVLRQFLYQRDLYEVGLGGVSYYGLLMMIVSFLQLHPRPEATTTHVNLGVLLIEFFELYGRKFNYSAVALKTKRGGSYAPKNELPTHLRSEQNSAMLCIEDPLNPFIGLGYDSFSAQQIRQAFTFAYATLNMAMNGVCEVDDFLPQESILGRIDHELGFRNPNVSCKFPILHPFDPSILSFVRLANPVNCFSLIKPYLQIDDEGYLRWNKTSLENDGYRTDQLYCTFQEIWRPDNDDFKFIYHEEKTFHGQNIKLASDFVYTQCKNWFNLVVYEDFLAFAQKKKNIRTYKDGEFDVLVVGLDSMSRLNFMRQLPKAYRLLMGQLDATVLIGFNKVGHNTFPNVVPMLTGRPLLQEPHLPFKDWPFIWKDFATAGAATMYTEDLPDINMFDYYDAGIDEQPTHHYMHTFWLATQASSLNRKSARLCLGSKPKHEIHFSYIKSFLKSYSENPKFLFSLINEPTHDFANTAGVVDDVLTDFLNSSYHEGLLNRSIVFVLGDHGNRLDSIRSTEVGKIEDFMPMVAAIVPPNANPSWKQHLKMNSNRFTSTYDLYATFVEILSTLGGFPGKPGNSSERIWTHFSQPPRGVSLFKEIPLKRGCEDAGVPEWFCTCYNGVELSKTDLEARRAASAVVKYLNEVLKNYTLCETLSLGEITAANLYTDSEHSNIEITFYASPSNALFQAGIKYILDSYHIGNLERINRYGSDAACLGVKTLSRNTLLKSICYCKTV